MLCAAQTEQAVDNGTFQQEGIASWYGADFAGRSTASGEIFDPSQLTAAHPSLPFGTILRVTNQQNNKYVTVRVNDRGPYAAGRIIDVSQAAAEQLDIISTGTAPVKVESLNLLIANALDNTPDSGVGTTGIISDNSGPIVSTQSESPAPSTPPTLVPASTPASPLVAISLPPAEIKPSLPPTGTNRIYRLQVGSFKVARNAVEAFDKLKNVGLEPAYERNGELFRVVLAGIKADEIPAVAVKLGAAGFREALVREEP
jgi:rare lipoprotein A